MVRTVAAAVLAALALVLVPDRARAEAAPADDEPWDRQTSAEARQRAQELFTQALDKHQQLLLGEALELYEQALALWDSPRIRWNLALVLENLGQYLRAHEQLERARRWGAALDAERLRKVDDRMRALEAERLARIETHREEPLAVITLDGQPWPRDAGRRSKLVLPGEHYIAARKPGYLPVTRSVYVKAGEQARVALLMDEDRFLEKRRWPAWKPWTVVAAGAAVAAVGAELERRAFADRAAAAAVLRDSCDPGPCDQARALLLDDRAKLEHGLGIGAIAAGGTVMAVGLALAWLNQPRPYRAEARAPSKIELTPLLSPQRAELSVLLRF
jgi:tetratricopeptide (TPR) repeat protein